MNPRPGARRALKAFQLRAVRARARQSRLGFAAAGKPGKPPRDGDHDGKIFDGTPQERPAPRPTQRALPAPTARRALPAPTRPAAPTFTLTNAAARRKATFEATGKGKTSFLFDMKKGDLPGQTSLLEQVGSVEVGKPTLRDQAAAHRASKGTTAERAARVRERLKASARLPRGTILRRAKEVP